MFDERKKARQEELEKALEAFSGERKLTSEEFPAVSEYVRPVAIEGKDY